MDLEQANQLIAEYNRIEAEQTERLRQIYDFVNGRSGYRKVAFGPSYSWSNCWGWGANQAERYRAFTDGLARPITEFTAGDA